MRGFPPLQIFLLGMAFALLAVPLARVTGNGSHPGTSATSEVDASLVEGGTEHPEGEHHHVKVPTVIRLRYAHQPLSISLKQEGREVLAQLDFTRSPIESRSQIEVSHDGTEMVLTATWPPGTSDTALTLEIEPDGFETRTQTFWSSAAALDEILTFTW